MANYITTEQLRQWVVAELNNWPSQESYAAANGFSAQYLSDFLNGRRDPGDKILDAIGFERIVRFRRKKVNA